MSLVVRLKSRSEGLNRKCRACLPLTSNPSSTSKPRCCLMAVMRYVMRNKVRKTRLLHQIMGLPRR